MRTISCQSSADLRAFLETLGPDALFRGQTREYLTTAGVPDIRTSFDRHGCVPSRMQKWWHYSRAILAAYVKGFDDQTDLATDQAILQHYGWRSFFIDATSDPAVACWFAGHSFKSNRIGGLIEDCLELPVIIQREEAWYEPANEMGCVYVFSRKALRAQDLQAVDLVEITTATGRPRFLAQSAFMLGPVSDYLPDDCIVARVYAHSTAFAEVAAGNALSMEVLFPSPAEDPVLASLLTVPWEKIQVEKSLNIDFFRRGLPLPEYRPRPIRRCGAAVAFYRRFWIADAVAQEDVWSETRFYLTGESLFHGTSEGTNRFPHLSRLLLEHGSVAVEINGLIRYLPTPHSQYGKGIYFETKENDIVLLCELAVDHPGSRPSDFGLPRGKHFRMLGDGTWVPIAHPEDCDCGNARHHAHHLTVAEHFEARLADGDFTPVRDRVFATPDVDPTSEFSGWRPSPARPEAE